MTSFIKIIKENNDTFYDYRNGKKRSQILRAFITIILSALLSLFLDKPDENLISAIITVQAILVGFGFSVLFFLVSSDHKKQNSEDSMETKERTKRLNQLSDELFYNVSYYNLITVCSVLFSLLFLLSAAAVPSVEYISKGINYIGSNYPEYLNSGWFWILAVAKFIFYVIFIESMYTFYRIVIRVNFFFSQKRKILSE